MSQVTDMHLARRAHRVLLAGVMCAAVVTFVPAAASAGTWGLVSCSQPNGQPAPTEGWGTGATGTVGPYSGDVNSCPQSGALIAVSSGEAPQRPYEGPEWIFQAPSGSTIAGGSITAMLSSPHGQAWLGTPSVAYDSADLLANCQYNLACGSTGTLAGTFPITHTGGTNLYAVAVCVGAYEGATSCPTVGGVDASISISAAEILLASNATPAGSGVGGTLLGANARGSQDLTFTASDPGGPGVYSVTVQVDGKTLYSGTPDSNAGKCIAVANSGGVLMFDYSQPCRSSESVDIPVNTALVADGQHTLKVTVQDAAQNSSVVYDATITTSNAPAASSPPTILAPSQVFVGAALATNPGSWATPSGAGTTTYGYQWESCDTQANNCQPIAGAQNASYTPGPADIGHTLRVTVNASDSDGLTSATSKPSSVVLSAQGTLGAGNGSGKGGAGTETPPGAQGTPNGSNASEGATIHLGVRGTITRIFPRRALKLTGRLVDNHAAAISGATLDILQQTAGNAMRVVGHARTRTDGTFIAGVPAGSSRLIEVAYRAFSQDTNYAAQARTSELVRAGVRLEIAPRATGATGTIVLTGQVLGPVPRQGTIVELLVHYRGRWEPFRTPRTDSHGHFQEIYQFEGSTGRFPFRATVPSGQAGFPFARGYSKVVDVSAG